MKKSLARIAAATKGEATYVPENPCMRGHVLRVTSSGSCIECRRATEKARYYSNPEKTKARVQGKYLANAEKLRQKRRTTYATNREVEKAAAQVRSAEWRLKNPNHKNTKLVKARYKQENPAKRMADVAKRRAAKLLRTPVWLSADDFWLIEQAYELAALRTKTLGVQFHVDHVLPLQGKYVSGLHTPINLQVIPWRDNVSKANKYLPA